MTQNIETMRELVSQIAAADAAYYKHDDPIITDREYDALYEELAALEQTTGIILSGSPTQRVSGEVLEGLTQVRHTKPMLSAQKTKSADEVIRFISGKQAVVSWKMDGLTLVLRYEEGRLTQALTRGGEGGMIGEDVTHSVRAMVNVPLTIPYTGSFEVRGEGVVSWENFGRANRDAEVPYTHPRSMAAGGIRRLDADKTRAQLLEFFAFELVSDGPGTKHGQLAFLSDNGFSIVYHLVIGERSSDKQIQAMINVFRPLDYAYPTDGLIIEYDDLAYGQSLGATGHHENRMIALKWADELYETTFLGLELATTRTGMVSLTGKFEDVVIDGTTVNRAYLHNLDVLDRFRLGIGDRVKIYKANQIIPQLAENLTKSGTLAYPTECPCCGSFIVIRASDSGTRLLYCDNPSCPAKLVRRFVHFCDRTRMDLEGFSEKTLSRLIEAGLVKNLGDLYELRPHSATMARLPGFGTKLVQRLLDAVEAGRQRTLAQFIAGLGIPMVGRSAGRILDKHFGGDWDAFEQAIRDGYDFAQLQDFGQTMHNNIYTWYVDKEEEKFWCPLLKHITFMKNEKENDPTMTFTPFYGKTVVATGKMANYTRDGIQAKLISLGALGVTILTEAQFEEMLAGETA